MLLSEREWQLGCKRLQCSRYLNITGKLFTCGYKHPNQHKFSFMISLLIKPISHFTSNQTD